MTRQGLLGIDLGTGSVKALLVDDRGATLGRGSAEHPLHHPRPGHAEQNPDDWWTATGAAVREALKQSSGAEVAGIGLSGQMHGTVLLGRDARPLCPAVIWADTRSGDEAREIGEAVGRERLIELTGSPVASGFQAATIRWMASHRPEVWSEVAHVLLPKDEIRRRLTGEIATEPSDASGTLLLDVTTRDWAQPVLDAVGVSRRRLPRIVDSDAQTGTLTAEAARHLGLGAGIPVFAGAGDAPAGALGAGVVDADAMLLTISTGAQVFAPISTVRTDRQGRIHTFCGAASNGEGGGRGAGWYLMGATMVAGLAMRWLRDAVFGLDPAGAYARMTEWATEVEPGAGGLVFLPYLAGERTPHMNANARGVLLGLTADHGRGNLVRAVMEGVAYALLDAYDVVRAAGARPRRIVLAGGGAQSPLWRRIVADVFGLTVSPLATAEQSALGAALLAGAGLGRFDLAETAQRWAAYGDPVDPAPSNAARYAELTGIFRHAYLHHQADFDALTRIDRG